MCETQVVNVKVQFIRPRYKNLEDWMSDPNNIYIGRQGVVFIDGKRFPPEKSPFANPFKIDKNNNREQVVEKYKQYIIHKVEKKEIDLSLLKNKRLGCWCKPEQCHGDVLVELLQENKYCS